MRTYFSASLLVLGLVAVVPADSKSPGGPGPIPVVDLKRAEPVLYEKDIEPILANKCLYCHSGTVKRNDLDLSSFETLLKGGKGGPAIVAGKSADSLLIRLAGRTAKPIMPPKSEVPLSAEELALIKLWIEQGARPPSGERERPQTVLTSVPAGVRSVRSVAVSPDKLLVAAGRANQVHLYNAGSGAHLGSLESEGLRAAHPSIVEALAFSPDGKLLASGSHQEVILWDVATRRPRQKWTCFMDDVVALAFSRDGKLLATGGGTPSVDGEIKIIDVASGKVLADIKNGHTDTVYAVCFSPDGARLASGGADRLVKVFEVSSGKLLKVFEGHTHHVLDLSWKGDGKLLASAGADKVIRVWDWEKGAQALSLPDRRRAGRNAISITKEVARVAFLGNTSELVACSGDQVGVWNADNGEAVRRLSGATGFLAALAVSPDGEMVAVGGDQGVVWLWSASNERLLRTLIPPGATSPSAATPVAVPEPKK